MNYDKKTELGSGDLVYTLHEKFHRLDGPAVIFNSNVKDQYWVNHEFCDDVNDYIKKVRKYKINKLIGK